MQLHFSKKSRAKYIAICVTALMAIFVLRLFQIQVIEHQSYSDQADSEQMRKFTLYASRGEIYAMDGDTPSKLVMNETVYTVWADPTLVTDKNAVVTALNEVAGGNVRDNFAKYLDVKKSRYQVLATKVTRTQAQMLKSKKLAGVGFDAVSQRNYPEGPLASQVLGFVNAEGEGVYGFEQANNDALHGKNGLLKTVTDVRDVPLTVTDKNIKQPAVDGRNFVLTIDKNVQAATEEALAAGIKKSGATHASAIVMDPQTGKVLAMANMPTYHPGELHAVTDVSAFNNDTVSRPYEPGSDIKTFTVAMGIDRGVITPESMYNNTGEITVGDKVIGNASRNAAITGTISMQTALDWSLNTGMVTIAERLGDGNTITRGARDTIYDYFYNKFRLARPTGIELANEGGGTIIAPDQPNGNAVQYATTVFGQGMNATMLQVASGFCAVINGGTYHTPSIIAGEMQDGEFKQAALKAQYPGVISAEASRTTREMVHQSHYATYDPHDGSDRFYIGGKTGTSQTLINGAYSSDQTIGTYLGFGGQKNETPRYVIMVDISAPGKAMGGGTDAKPIFNQISNWMISYLRLTPEE